MSKTGPSWSNDRDAGEAGNKIGYLPGADVVTDCRREMKLYGLTNAQAAKEIGVSQTTVSKWLRGEYEGDVPATNEKVARWLKTRREARQRDLSGAGLDRHIDLGVTEEVMSVLGHAHAAGDVVLVHGRSGAGKSWAAERYCGTHSAAYRVSMTEAVATLAGLLTRVAEAVGAGTQHSSGLAAETAVIGRLRDRGALLCVDEAHHLSPRLLDELRCVRDLAGCGLALIGGDELWTALASSRRCDQIVGRIGIRLPLTAPAEVDVVELASAVIGREPDPKERKAILAAARGAGGLHALRRYLTRAWILARGNKRNITAADLAAAAEQVAV